MSKTRSPTWPRAGVRAAWCASTRRRENRIPQGIDRQRRWCHAVRMTETEGYVDQPVMGFEDPQPMYKMLRETPPVSRAPQGPVVLSRLADIEMALKRTDLFSSNMDAVDLGTRRSLIPRWFDPPAQTKYRRISV